MKIVGIDGMTNEELADELDRGGRFVIFTYTISILVMTFQRPSHIYFLRSGDSALAKGMGCTLLSLAAGWWGIPWGPIYTIGSVARNLGGGKDVTNEVLASWQQG